MSFIDTNEIRKLLECAAKKEKDLNSRASLRRDEALTPILLFGCGHLGKTTCARLQQAGIKADAFVDNDPRKWGKACMGLEILSQEMAIRRFGADARLVNCVYTASSLDSDVRRSGLNVIPYADFAFTYSETLIPHGSLDRPGRLLASSDRIIEAAGLWKDETSCQEFVAQIRYRATLKGPMPPFLDPSSTYFPEEIVDLDRQEVFIDCGAFDGDSIRAFLRRSGGWFGGVVGIEADPENAARLKAFVESLPESYAQRTRLVEVAVGAEEGTVSFQVTGTAESTFTGSIQGNQVQVPCRPLDAILKDIRPSYIKMDIEGAEPLALAGAAETIRKHSPVLAICLYHEIGHLWEIPLQIRSYTDRYDFFLRRYSDNVWEQVCYAVPKDRVKR